MQIRLQISVILTLFLRTKCTPTLQLSCSNLLDATLYFSRISFLNLEMELTVSSIFDHASILDVLATLGGLEAVDLGLGRQLAVGPSGETHSVYMGTFPIRGPLYLTMREARLIR